jgi:hypothetical protein
MFLGPKPISARAFAVRLEVLVAGVLAIVLFTVSL